MATDTAVLVKDSKSQYYASEMLAILNCSIQR